jgi:hypothetical protein
LAARTDRFGAWNCPFRHRVRLGVREWIWALDCNVFVHIIRTASVAAGTADVGKGRFIVFDDDGPLGWLGHLALALGFADLYARAFAG